MEASLPARLFSIARFPDKSLCVNSIASSLSSGSLSDLSSDLPNNTGKAVEKNLRVYGNYRSEAINILK